MRRTELVCQIGIRSPGMVWRRGAAVWQGIEGRSYIWVRCPWRMAAAWATAAAVFGLIAWGLVF